MPYDLRYLEDDGIVFTEYIPPTPNDELAKIVEANLELAAEKGALLFLGDVSALPNSASVIDVYELAAMLDRMGVDRRMREALVVGPDPLDAGSFDFYVTATSNRGLQVRLFGTVEEAKEWLRAEGARLSAQ
jgi:hypothetical protein